MTPALDIEKAVVGGIAWANVSNDSQCLAFNTWFAALAAAGWQTVASEHGNTGYPYYSNNAGVYFSGYINYNIPYVGVSSGLSSNAAAGQKNVSVTNGAGFFNGETVILHDETTGANEQLTIASGAASGAATFVMTSNLVNNYSIYDAGTYITPYCYWDVNPNVTQNLFEYYYNSDISYIEAGTEFAAEMETPSGLLAYPVPPSVGLPMWNNSVGGTPPTYQQMLDWSYANGVGMNSFAVWIDPNFDTIELAGADPIYFLLYYFNMQGPQVINSLQTTYRSEEHRLNSSHT